MTWYWWVLTVWLSISFGFVLGATWCAYFKQLEINRQLEAQIPVIKEMMKSTEIHLE